MASISTPRIPISSSSTSRHHADPNPLRLPSRAAARLLSSPHRHRLLRWRLAGARPSDSALRRCRNSGHPPPSPPPEGGAGGVRRRWDSLLHEAVQSAVRQWGEYLSSLWGSSRSPPPRSGEDSQASGLVKEVGYSKEEKEEREELEEVVDGDWSWERWKRHFALVEESERLVAELKLHLRAAIAREDYKSAQKLKLAIAATAKYDAVGRAISDLNRAIEEERYSDAAYIRDHAGAGLLGWWSGISGNVSDPYGLIIHISAEHGKYVAKSYDSRQLASRGPGFPIFEVYFTERNGEYKQQAVYLKPDGNDTDELQEMSGERPEISIVNISGSSLGGEPETYNENTNSDDESDDDIDMATGLAGLHNLSGDINPVYINLKLVLEEDDDGNDTEIENGSSEDIRDEDNTEERETDSAKENGDTTDGESEIPTLILVGSFKVYMKELALQPSPKKFVHMPARLEKRDRFSFSFYTEQNAKKQEIGRSRQVSKEKNSSRSINQDADLLPDLAKLIGSNKKVFRKIFELDMKRRNNIVQKNMFGVTHFSRILMPSTSDPLSGLYVAASGLDSEILYLQRKFGQWREDNSSKKYTNLEFYEYVEAVKLTGDNLVPVGQISETPC